ncbi:MAG: glycosyltransferase family 4 protein [Phycisphaerae bacterium]
MRVLMTTDTVGGVWTYTLQLASALAPMGVSVDLATMGSGISEAQHAAAGEIPNIRLHPSSFKLEWMQDPWNDVDRAQEWLLELEQRTHPDLVHVNGFAHGAAPFLAPVLAVGHSCVLSWWQAVRHESAPAEWATYQQRVREGLQAAGHVVAPSRNMLDCLIEHYGPLNSSEVIYNGRSAAIFKPAAKLQMVFAAGRLWDPAKNMAALDAAAAEISWPVWVAGDTRPDAGKTEPTHARLLGKLTERQIAARLAAASIYAFPAKYEPFGLSVLEAALSGCALVLGDIPSLREIWRDCAIYVPPENVRELVQALRYLIHDSGERARLAGMARLRAREFSPERMAKGYMQAYRKLLSGRTQMELQYAR